MIHFIVGYDIREHAAWKVCEKTLLDAGAASVTPLCHRELRREGLFSRPWLTEANGQMVDLRDGRPFSTDFSHSRFLVPALARARGLSGYVAFVDCDFMFLDRIADLEAALDPSKVISVVKHDFERVVEGMKMDGMVQQRYFRKLWSSLMIWNMDHSDIHIFQAEMADKFPGSFLHSIFELDDEKIGAIPERWNYIPGHSDRQIIPAAIHWSFGGPWMEGYEDVQYAEDWRWKWARILDEVVTKRDYAALFPLL